MEVLKEVELERLKFRLVKGDITKYPAEAIVNAANEFLEHEGGVALAIARAATNGDPERYTRLSKEEMMKQVGRDRIRHGEVVVTPALSLERYGIRYVIHTVGPMCGGRWGNEFKEKLRRALMAPLRKADEMRLKSIAFPAVSAGIYGCPVEEVVKTFLEVVRDFARSAESVEEVALVLFDDASVHKALEVLEE